MKITQILTPELIYGLRGDHNLISLYQSILNGITKVGPGLHGNQVIQFIDLNMQYHFALAWKYKKETPRNYYVGREFLEAIYQVRSDIPLDLLPDRFFAYVAFPKDCIFDDARDPVEGGFIFIGPATETMIDPNQGWNRAIWCSWSYSPLKELKWGSIIESLDQEISFKSLVQKYQSEIGTNLLMLFANLVLYITKCQPELFPLKASNMLTNKEKREFEKTHNVVNGCELPITLVSWNYQKPKSYNVDSTTVSGHFRWQRHGPESSLLKLIYIDEHIRNYSN